MADDIRTSDSGAWIITLTALLGCAVAIYNYNAPDNGISGTAGAMLVIYSSIVLIVAGFILGRDMGGRVLHVMLATLALLTIIGTGFAAWLLESNVLMVLMGISLFGWLVRLFRSRSAYA